MVGELIFGILLSVVSTVAFVESILALLKDDTKESVLLLICSLVLIAIASGALYDYSEAKKEGGYIQKIENAKEVQIDTVYTVTKEKIDTTYVINYKI